MEDDTLLNILEERLKRAKCELDRELLDWVSRIDECRDIKELDLIVEDWDSLGFPKAAATALIHVINLKAYQKGFKKLYTDPSLLQKLVDLEIHFEVRRSQLEGKS